MFCLCSAIANSPYNLSAYREPIGRPATLGQLLRNPDSKWLWISCRVCRRYVAVAYALFAIRWGKATDMDMFRRRFRCSQCGTKGALTTAPSWDVETQMFQSYPVERGLRVLCPTAWLDSMCNLYAFRTSRQEIARHFHLSDNRMGETPDLPGIFPRSKAPVIRVAADGERELVTMVWGFVLLMDGKAPRPVTNVRDDKIRTSSFWRVSFEQRRCLVPATSFCDPDGGKPAKWHWFALKGDVPRPLFAFPGIWKRYKGPVKKDGPAVEIDTYAFLTSKPNAVTEPLGHGRMPVMLTSRDDYEQWLYGSNDLAMQLAHPYPPHLMHEVQAGLDKSDNHAAHP